MARRPDLRNGVHGVDDLRKQEIMSPDDLKQLRSSLSRLTRTPAALNALLRDLPGTWTQCNEGENSWTAFDVVGHLIHAERTDWIPRAKIILQFGDAQPFAAFDRSGHERECKGKSLSELLDEFARVRADNVAELRRL